MCAQPQPGLPLTGAIVCLLGLFCLAGCVADESWRMGKARDVSLVEKTWRTTQVATQIGRPDYVIKGRDLHLGWEEWVYPTGSVFIYRMEVKHVIRRAPGAPQPQPPEDKWAGFGVDVEDEYKSTLGSWRGF